MGNAPPSGSGLQKAPVPFGACLAVCLQVLYVDADYFYHAYFKPRQKLDHVLMPHTKGGEWGHQHHYFGVSFSR